MHPFEIDLRVFAEHEQEQAAFLVLDEEVLGMAAGDVAAQRRGFLDCEERRMFDSVGRDGEAGEESEEVFRRGGHLGSGGCAAHLAPDRSGRKRVTEFMTYETMTGGGCLICV